MADPALNIQQLPPVRGRYTENAALGEVGWFRTGGRAEILFKPADRADLSAFLGACPSDVPITVLGVMSNVIVRDGGIQGVVIRLGRDFNVIEAEEDHRIFAGAACLDLNVAEQAAQWNIGGLEFLSGVPGTVGGGLRMNAGAYGTEVKNILVEAEAIDRSGFMHRLPVSALGMSYRHIEMPDDLIFTGAIFQGIESNREKIEAKIAEIREKRAATQPIRARTGGSTFANPSAQELIVASLPPETRTWQLIDQVGGRGYKIGDAMMSDLHCNFMINNGSASAFELEKLGEDIRRRVFEKFGISLRWEIKRLGEFKGGETISYTKGSLQ